MYAKKLESRHVLARHDLQSASNSSTMTGMITTLTGTNRYTLQAAIKARTAAFANEHGDMALERLDGEEVTLDRISEALNSLPFLTSKKMVVLRQPSLNKEFTEQAAELLKNIPETTEVLLVEPKPDKRSSYYKYLKKNTDYQQYDELDQHGLARWLSEQASAKGGQLAQADARYLVARVGLNQQLLANELEKLLLHGNHITIKAIDALTEPTPQSTVFKLLDAAFSGDARRAMELYAQQRALKVEPQQIIAMLSWQLHIVALIKTAGERTPDQIASEAKVSPYTVKKSLSIARQLTLAKLKKLISDLVEIDQRSKAETFDLDNALQNYILKLAQ